MQGASGAGQQAVGGVGGAMAATSRPASIPAVGVNADGMTKTESGLSAVGKGLQGFGSLFQGAQSAAPSMISTPTGGLRPVTIANYALQNDQNPFGSAGLQSLDPSMLKALLASHV